MALLRDLGKRQKIRYLMILLGAFLFIAPFGLLPQLIGKSGFWGIYCPRMFWTIRSDTTISSFIAGIVRSYGGVILVAGIVITSFFFGRYWCSHVCPVGGITEIGSRAIPEVIKFNYSTVSAPVVRYGYLSVYLLAPLFAIGSLCCNYCNFAVVPRLLGAPFNSADIAYFFRTTGIMNLGLIAVLGFLVKRKKSVITCYVLLVHSM
ncbi:MAG: 4Fe-4S binding protein [Nitrospirota bacterium]